MIMYMCVLKYVYIQNNYVYMYTCKKSMYASMRKYVHVRKNMYTRVLEYVYMQCNYEHAR